MKIVQLAGNRAGETLDVSIVVARAMIAQGTGRWPDDPVPADTDKIEFIDDDNVGHSLADRGRGWFEIVDANGNVVSEKKMRRDEAEEALAAL